MKAKRGELGYIRAKKRKSLLGTFLMIVIGAAIFLLGLFLNGMSNRNLFTVIAVLFVLPGARFLVAYIVMFPYHSVSEERYQRIKAALPENTALYTDLVITSSEKVMHLDFIVIGQGQVIGLLGGGKQEITYVRKYLSDGAHNWGADYKVKILEKEKAFLGEISRLEPKEVDLEEEKQVCSYFLSLIV